MNYIFGIGVALWALAGWVAVRERAWPERFALSTACVRRAVLLPSLGARHLRHRRARVRDFAAVGAAARTLAGPHRRFRRQRSAVPRRGAAAQCQPDHGACRRHLLGPARQDRRADVCHQRLFRHRRLRARYRHGRQHRVGASATMCCAFIRWSLSLLVVGAVVYLASAAHHVRHLHDRPARADRRRLHAVRLRRSGTAPPPGAAGFHGRPDRPDRRRG